jgi:hypothetical protein
VEAIGKGSNTEKSIKKIALECVLLGATKDEGPSHLGDVHVVDEASVTLVDYEQASNNAIDGALKLITSRKKNKEKGVGIAKTPKGPKKGQPIPIFGSKALRNTLSKKASSNPAPQRLLFGI